MTTALRRAVTLTDDDAETTFGVAMDAHLDRDSVLAPFDKMKVDSTPRVAFQT